MKKAVMENAVMQNAVMNKADMQRTVMHKAVMENDAADVTLSGWESVAEVYARLRAAYGDHGWWPLLVRDGDGWRSDYRAEHLAREMTETERFEICLGAILTQNANWRNAERALIRLRDEGIDSPEKLLAVDPAALGQLIRSSGYYNQKAERLRIFSLWLLSGQTPTRDGLLALKGLGPETVDDMLLYAFGEKVFVVDAYTKRLFSRLGFCRELIPYADLQRLITAHFDSDRRGYRLYHALIVQHAKQHCRKTPACGGCPLLGLCPHPTRSLPAAGSGFDGV